MSIYYVTARTEARTEGVGLTLSASAVEAMLDDHRPEDAQPID